MIKIYDYLWPLQVTIIDTGVRGMIAVGLVPQMYKLDHQPGWLPNSVAFHADDGKYVTMLIFLTYCRLNVFIMIIGMEMKPNNV